MNNPANWYSGWTSFAKMKNRDPPLVIAYSSPIKCKLTPEVSRCLTSPRRNTSCCALLIAQCPIGSLLVTI